MFIHEDLMRRYETIIQIKLVVYSNYIFDI